jgi:hypothetical protein
MKLKDYFPTRPVPAVTVEVQTYAMLDELIDSFGGGTAVGECILDCIHLDAATAKERLANILNIPTDTEFPEDGYIIFWC